MLWHIELKFCTWLCFNVLQIKFECHHFASIFEGVMPLCELRIWEIHSFPHFSPTCFDILSWNFAHDFVLICYRASSSVVTLHQFLKELSFFVDLVCRKYSFPHFSPTCFDILSWNFAHDFVLMYYRSSLSVITLRQFLYARLQTGRIMVWWCLSGSLSGSPSGLRPPVFRTFLLPALTYWAEILHMTLF